MRRFAAAPSSLALFAGIMAASLHGCASDSPAPKGADPFDASCVGSMVPDTAMTSPDVPATPPQPDVDAGVTPEDPFFSAAKAMLEEGRRTFRKDTFGDEAFWGDALQLHKAILGATLGPKVFLLRSLR
jgi:hypothetical protein